MNPAFQFQIYNPATGQYVQMDGGADANAAIMLNLLIQQYTTNHYLRSIMLGQVPADAGGMFTVDLFTEPSIFKLG